MHLATILSAQIELLLPDFVSSYPCLWPSLHFLGGKMDYTRWKGTENTFGVLANTTLLKLKKKEGGDCNVGHQGRGLYSAVVQEGLCKSPFQAGFWSSSSCLFHSSSNCSILACFANQLDYTLESSLTFLKNLSTHLPVHSSIHPYTYSSMNSYEVAEFHAWWQRWQALTDYIALAHLHASRKDYFLVNARELRCVSLRLRKTFQALQTLPRIYWFIRTQRPTSVTVSHTSSHRRDGSRIIPLYKGKEFGPKLPCVSTEKKIFSS